MMNHRGHEGHGRHWMHGADLRGDFCGHMRGPCRDIPEASDMRCDERAMHMMRMMHMLHSQEGMGCDDERFHGHHDHDHDRRHVFGGLRGMFARHFGGRPKECHPSMRGVFNLGVFQEDAFDVVIEENADENVVHVMLPGVAKENISLSNLPGMLLLRVAKSEKDGGATTEQALLLGHCDESAIHARHRDGVLEIFVPKTKGQEIEVK